jgi:tetratricopeptide (TPR) repeat protein
VIASDDARKISILFELTDLTSPTDPDKALDYAQQSLELAEETDNHEGKLHAYLQMAQIYYSQSDYRSSLEIGNKAKLLASDLDLQKEFANSLSLLAKTFSALGEYNESADLNFQALRIFEERGDKIEISNVYNQIGSDYFYQENSDKALEFYAHSLEIARENQDLKGISRGLNNVAIVYARKDDFEHVIKNLEESIEINKLLDRRLWVGINYLNLSEVYRSKESFDTAFNYINNAEIIFTELNSISNMAAAYLGLSLYYFELQNLDSSLYYAKRTYDISRENDIKIKLYHAVQQQHEIYQLQNDFENAYKYCLTELKLKDSLDINNTMTRMSQLELLHEFDKREQENKIIQQRREYTLIIAGTIIVFVLLILVIYIISRSRIKAKNEQIKRRQLNLELEIKNRELAANVMTLIRKNEILSGMGDKLMDIQSEAVKEETKYAIKKIAKDLQKTTDAEIWDEFEVRFNQVHGDFYDKLHEQFPDLSPNEHRLCAFLRLNMTTKEISELTGQRIDTLEIARWRLRKKLKITNTKANLVTFLSEI